MNLIGDVAGKVAVLVDDMIDTAGARAYACKRLLRLLSLILVLCQSVSMCRFCHASVLVPLPNWWVADKSPLCALFHTLARHVSAEVGAASCKGTLS